MVFDGFYYFVDKYFAGTALCLLEEGEWVSSHEDWGWGGLLLIKVKERLTTTIKKQKPVTKNPSN